MKSSCIDVVLLLVGCAAALMDCERAAAQSPPPTFALVGVALIDGTAPVRYATA